MSYRLRPVDLCMADAMPFQQHHEARIAGRDLRDVLTSHLLLNVRTNVQVGDEVVVCGYSDQTWRRLRQFARLRVTTNSKDAVEFVLDGDVREIPICEAEPEPVKHEPRLEVVRGLRCFNVIEKNKQAVLESFKTKAEAEAWAAQHDAL